MSDVVNIHHAKTRLSQLVARAERGSITAVELTDEPIVAARRARGARGRAPLAPEDPLLNLDAFAVAGPGGKLTNQDIDRILSGKP